MVCRPIAARGKVEVPSSSSPPLETAESARPRTARHRVSHVRSGVWRRGRRRRFPRAGKPPPSSGHA